MTLVVLLGMLYTVESSLFPGRPVIVQYALAFAIAGLMLSVFSVAIPVSWARYHPEGLLARSMGVLMVCLRLCWPVVGFLHLFDPVVRRISGGERSDLSDEELTEEIMSVVEEHQQEGGGVDEAQKEMIEAVVEFPTTTVDRIMTPRTEVQGIDLGASIQSIKETIAEEGHSRIPVYRENLDDIVGVLYVKDMIRLVGSDEPFDLQATLREALMVPESKPVRELLSEFRARKVHIAIVLDEYGGTAGLVTIEDILEEIVGEIQDEYEPHEQAPAVRRIDDTTVDVDARVPVDDLNDELGLSLPEDRDYDTVGGFVFATLGHVPDVGESFEQSGLTFTVTDAARTRVKRVRVQRPSPSHTPDNGNGR